MSEVFMLRFALISFGGCIRLLGGAVLVPAEFRLGIMPWRQPFVPCGVLFPLTSEGLLQILDMCSFDILDAYLFSFTFLRCSNVLMEYWCLSFSVFFFWCTSKVPFSFKVSLFTASLSPLYVVPSSFGDVPLLLMWAAFFEVVLNANAHRFGKTMEACVGVFFSFPSAAAIKLLVGTDKVPEFFIIIRNVPL